MSKYLIEVKPRSIFDEVPSEKEKLVSIIREAISDDSGYEVTDISPSTLEVNVEEEEEDED